MSTQPTKSYYVLGGIYADASHTVLAEGEEGYRIGPFLSYETALMALQGKKLDYPDTPFAHFYIHREDYEVLWVVGGTYTDSSFTQLQPGTEEERIGPFTDYDEAAQEWRARSMAHIDEAFVRYRLDKV